MIDNRLTPRGRLGLRRIGAAPARPATLTVEDALRQASPARGAADRWRTENLRQHFDRSLADMDRFQRGWLPLLGQLWMRKVDARGRSLDLGLVSCRVVTNAGVGFIVDSFQNLTEGEAMRYHGVGTGSTAESVNDTALAAELTTQYATSSTRPTGTTGEQAGAAGNVYETTATITVSAAVALTEHGIFSAPARGSGVLLDRSVFAAVNLAATESLQATYRLTVPAGG